MCIIMVYCVRSSAIYHMSDADKKERWTITPTGRNTTTLIPTRNCAKTFLPSVPQVGSESGILLINFLAFYLIFWEKISLPSYSLPLSLRSLKAYMFKKDYLDGKKVWKLGSSPHSGWIFRLLFTVEIYDSIWQTFLEDSLS